MTRNSITLNTRREIEQRLKAGEKVRDIAYHVNLSQTAVYDELRRGMDERGIYEAERAEEVYAGNIKRRGNRGPRRKAEVAEAS